MLVVTPGYTRSRQPVDTHTHTRTMVAEAPGLIHERILARAPPRSLHKSCNGVLQLEVSDIDGHLRGVVEVFRSLKEVEAAVTQLQHDKADRQRSVSLMALIADTERVQSSLLTQMDRLGCSEHDVATDPDAVGTLLR